MTNGIRNYEHVFLQMNFLQEREKMKEQKGFLIEALVRLAMSHAESKGTEATQKFLETLQRLKAWADIDGGDKYGALVIEREISAGRYGGALKQINRLLSKDTKDDVIKPLSRADLLGRRAEIFGKLGYSLLVEYDKSTRVIACPKSYTLF
jgi:hypothetical protein